MPVPFEVGDYVVVKKEKSKVLAFVTKITDDSCTGDIEKNRPYKDEQIEFKYEDVIANLGDELTIVGSVFNNKTEAYNTSVDHQLGDVHFFYRAGKADIKEATDLLDFLSTIMQRHRLLGMFPVNFEFRVPRGSYDGMYVKSRKEDALDTIRVFLNEEKDMKHVILHEAGHGVWTRLIKQNVVKAAWVKEYRTHNFVTQLSVDKLEDLFKDMEDTRLTIPEFKATLEEEPARHLQEAIKHIKHVHGLWEVDLDTLILSSDYDELYEVWPKTGIEISSMMANEISEYSSKNVEEYFCEALTLYLLKQKIPPRTQKLIEKTLAKIAGTK